MHSLGQVADVFGDLRRGRVVGQVGLGPLGGPLANIDINEGIVDASLLEANDLRLESIEEVRAVQCANCTRRARADERHLGQNS